MIRVEKVEPQRQSVPEEGAKWHEYASVFPMLDGQPYRDLVDDIRKNGVREPVVFLDGKILDGRNRYCAAREAGVDYPFIEYEGDDPLGYVISLNLKRRHLSESQRAMVAKKLETMRQGRPSGKDANLHVSREQASTMLNVSPRSVATAAKVIENGTPELAAAVEEGKVSVSAAAEVASLPKEEQAEIVAKGEKEVLAKAKEIKDRQKAEREAQKAENERQRDEARSKLNPEIQKRGQAKADAIAARNVEPVDAETLQAELEELREANAALEAENARLKAENAKWEDMRVQYEAGGFEKVVADMGEQIRVLRRQVEAESQEKVKNLRSMDFWKAEAMKRGYGEDDFIEIPGRAANA